MKRLLPLLCLSILIAVYVAAPRVIPNGPAGSGTPASAPSVSLGAPSELRVTGHTVPPATTPAPPTPHPSSKLGDWSCSDPPNCGEPTAKPKPLTVKASGGIAGQATWWYSFGPGIYAALRPDLGSKGDLVIVCGGQPFHCVTAPVITSCACLGPNSTRLVDLSLDLFREFADPSRGVVKISLQVVHR